MKIIIQMPPLIYDYDRNDEVLVINIEEIPY